ncbi:MAG: hydroxyacylglutathione hydrolase [Rhizobacter sp.]|nr:hydroxyacylglutathione hydrolase [Rhizobacter sp.]
MNLVALRAFSDNYIWMLHDGRQAVVVDPGDAAPVITALDEMKLELVGILVTHHHADHVGGVNELRPRLKGSVFGPARETIPEPFVPMAHGGHVDVLGMRFEVIDVPGHTAGHIAYFHQPQDADPIVFSGDTLFSGGCGRLFEGTPADMHGSLSRLAALPAATRVCCGHEYTLSNLKFAAAVEPGNADIAQYTASCLALRADDFPTLPSTIGLERRVTPFLRCDVPVVVQAAVSHGLAASASRPVPSGIDVLAALRQWKNDFR